MSDEEDGVTVPAAGSMAARIAAFQQAAKDATDPVLMVKKVAAISDKAKYKFKDGMNRDLVATRAALRAVSGGSDSCCFGELYDHIDGQIANLNKVLQNLRAAGEVAFEQEMFLKGTHDDALITLLEKFYEGEYSVEDDNVFRAREYKDVAEAERHGRSYVKENLATLGVTICATCDVEVSVLERMTVRDKVYHLRCLKCAQCGATPREKADYLSFDGQAMCSAACVSMYDASHLSQKRQ